MLDLRGGCVVVTGGAGLLGRALATAFARRGSHVVVADLDESAAEAVATELRGHLGVRAIAVSVDVTDRASMDLLADVAQQEFGAVRVLCNNAGVAVLNSVVDLTRDDWDKVLGVQLQGVLNGVHSFLPGLVAQSQRTHIVNTSSMSGVGRADLRVLNAPT
jgi:NAD(P)-dependent dehydrogenase (short-subunit alcohol dehydrogenase family)